jgi:basic membrane protein A
MNGNKPSYRHLLVGGIVLALLAVSCAPSAATPSAAQATEPPAQSSAEPTQAVAAPTEPVPTETPAKPFKVALIVQGELADGSWNQFEYDSMKEIEKEPGIEVSYSENVAIPDIGRVIGDYCRQGYDLVYAHSFDYQDPVLKAAAECPGMAIAGQGFWQFADNVAGLTVWPCEGGYIAGVLGGLMTKSNKLGLIGGFAYAPTQLCFHEAFKAGVTSVNPDAHVAETWTGTWYDVALGYEAANAMIDDGVDFIAISLSGPGFGAIDAAKDHNDKGGNKVYAVGNFVDMDSRAPGTVITSVVWKTTQPTLDLINAVRDGTFEGKNYEFFMAGGSLEMAPYHECEDEIPQSVKDKVAEVEQQIMDGTLKVPIITEAPEE